VVGVTLLQLLGSARTAGLELDRGPDGLLRIRGPKSTDALARGLLARKAEVLTIVHLWHGRADALDWRQAHVLDWPRRCMLCGRPTLLLDPWDREPTHKTCAELLIRPTGGVTMRPSARRTA
jgi:hypothetical protein